MQLLLLKLLLAHLHLHLQLLRGRLASERQLVLLRWLLMLMLLLDWFCHILRLLLILPDPSSICCFRGFEARHFRLKLGLNLGIASAQRLLFSCYSRRKFSRPRCGGLSKVSLVLGVARLRLNAFAWGRLPSDGLRMGHRADDGGVVLG